MSELGGVGRKVRRGGVPAVQRWMVGGRSGDEVLGCVVLGDGWWGAAGREVLSEVERRG